jgi:hypothetical protein
MTENPYRLARDIRGIGFKTADAIAMRLGIEKTALIRVRAGISYALTEAMDEGHCGLPAEELTPLAVELLEVPAELIQTALDLELAERRSLRPGEEVRFARDSLLQIRTLGPSRKGNSGKVEQDYLDERIPLTGTEGSNPSPSSEESIANLTFRGASQESWHRRACRYRALPCRCVYQSAEGVRRRQFGSERARGGQADR